MVQVERLIDPDHLVEVEVDAILASRVQETSATDPSA